MCGVDDLWYAPCDEVDSLVEVSPVTHPSGRVTREWVGG